MIEALDKAAMKDWQLAGMLCKTLWNFFDDASSVDDVMGGQLLSLLEHMLNESAMFSEVVLCTYQDSVNFLRSIYTFHNFSVRANFMYSAITYLSNPFSPLIKFLLIPRSNFSFCTSPSSTSVLSTSVFLFQ